MCICAINGIVSVLSTTNHLNILSQRDPSKWRKNRNLTRRLTQPNNFELFRQQQKMRTSTSLDSGKTPRKLKIWLPSLSNYMELNQFESFIQNGTIAIQHFEQREMHAIFIPIFTMTKRNKTFSKMRCTRITLNMNANLFLFRN